MVDLEAGLPEIQAINANPAANAIDVTPAPMAAAAQSNEHRPSTGLDPAHVDHSPHENAENEAQGGFTSIGHELDETAPLWRVYRDEVRIYDQNVTFDEWNKTLDVLLIFAGLFSAVVTTLVVATFPLLNPQDDDVTMAIYELARSINNNTALRPMPNPAKPVQPSSLWINWLWFTSLFISLAVAFFAILAKQWLVDYSHRMADPPATSSTLGTRVRAAATPTASLEWARRRGFFFDGFDKWHIPGIITQVLPFLLHIALFLFLVGLSVFVSTLNRFIGFTVVSLTCLLFALYFVTTALPIWWLDCPTVTPLVRQLRDFPVFLALRFLEIWEGKRGDAPDRPSSPAPASDPAPVTRVRTATDALERIRDSINRPRLGYNEQSKLSVMQRTLHWLFVVSGSETATAIALQSLGTLDPDEISNFLPDLQRITIGRSALSSIGSVQAIPSAVEVIRALRSELLLGRGTWSAPLLGLDVTSAMTTALQQTYYLDAKLLLAAMEAGEDHNYSNSKPDGTPTYITMLRSILDVLLSGAVSPTLSSTARLLIRTPDMPIAVLPYIILALGLDSIRKYDRHCIFRARDDHIRDGLNLHCALRTAPGHGETCSGPCIASLVFRLLCRGEDVDRTLGATLIIRFVNIYNERERSMLPYCPGFLDILTTPRLFGDRKSLLAVDKVLFPSTSHSPSATDVAHFARYCNSSSTKQLYIAALALMAFELGSRPVTHLETARDWMVFVEWLAERERGSNFELSPEHWTKVLDGWLTKPRVAFFSQKGTEPVLVFLSVLKRRQHIDEALTRRVYRYLDRVLQDIRLYADPGIWFDVHFMQHCTELFPDWRNSVAFDPRLAALHHIWLESCDTMIRAVGPCRQCPGTPPAWDPRYIDRPVVQNIDASRNLAGDLPIAANPFSVLRMLMNEEGRLEVGSHSLAPEIWAKLLGQAVEKVTPGDASPQSNLTLVLSCACLMQRRKYAGGDDLIRRVRDLIDDWLSRRTLFEFQAHPSHLHFVKHLAEIDSSWSLRLHLLAPPSPPLALSLSRAINIYDIHIKRRGPCTTCPGPVPIWTSASRPKRCCNPVSLAVMRRAGISNAVLDSISGRLSDIDLPTSVIAVAAETVSNLYSTDTAGFEELLSKMQHDGIPAAGDGALAGFEELLSDLEYNDIPTNVDRISVLNMLMGVKGRPRDLAQGLGHEVWERLLIHAVEMASPDPVLPLSTCKLLLSCACMMQREEHVGAAGSTRRVKGFIDDWLSRRTIAEFQADRGHIHFVRHLAELDSAWRARLHLLRPPYRSVYPSLGRAIMAYEKVMDKLGPCTICPGSTPIWTVTYHPRNVSSAEWLAKMRDAGISEVVLRRVYTHLPSLPIPGPAAATLLCPGTAPPDRAELQPPTSATASSSSFSTSGRDETPSYSSRLPAVAPVLAEDAVASVVFEELPNTSAAVESSTAADGDEDDDHRAAEQEASLW